MFLLLRLIRIFLPVLKDYFEDRRESRESKDRDKRDVCGPHEIPRHEASGDHLADTMAAYRRGDYHGAFEAASGLVSTQSPVQRFTVLPPASVCADPGPPLPARDNSSRSTKIGATGQDARAGCACGSA